MPAVPVPGWDPNVADLEKYCKSIDPQVQYSSRDLSRKLHRAQARSNGTDRYEFFIPRDQQDTLVTPREILNFIIPTRRHLNHVSAVQVAIDIHSKAKRLFAVLATIDRCEEIFTLLKDNVTDRDLPLRQNPSEPPHIVRTVAERPVTSMESWDPVDRTDFLDHQHRLTAPVFRLHRHANLDANAVLPFEWFRPTTGRTASVQGGYSEVFQKQLHRAHQEFRSGSRQQPMKWVAVKRLNSTNREDFQKEEHILKALRPKGNQHLIELLGTFKYNGFYHLIFPWATANLRNYWSTNPGSRFDNVQFMQWFLKQIHGITAALALIHDFEPTKPLGAPPADHPSQHDALLSVMEHEKFFGRHGDIKPENLLWFKESPDGDPLGVIQIADFGLGRFHGRESRSRLSPSQVVATLTYEPPECQLHRPVSRKYDIWSLACVYLEFITWILLGEAATHKFADAREKPAADNVTEDRFFKIVQTDHGQRDAEVFSGVLTWVDHRLHRSEKCTYLLHELLSLIMDQMLVVKQKERIAASELKAELEKLVKRSEKDIGFIVNRTPPGVGVRRHTRSPVRPASTWPSGRNYQME